MFLCSRAGFAVSYSGPSVYILISLLFKTNQTSLHIHFFIYFVSVRYLSLKREQDKSSDVEQQPPFANRK